MKSSPNPSIPPSRYPAIPLIIATGVVPSSSPKSRSTVSQSAPMAMTVARATTRYAGKLGGRCESVICVGRSSRGQAVRQLDNFIAKLTEGVSALSLGVEPDKLVPHKAQCPSPDQADAPGYQQALRASQKRCRGVTEQGYYHRVEERPDPPDGFGPSALACRLSNFLVQAGKLLLG